ncbi:MAG: hypothetical protein U0165_15550 [Polyangiaceae bacterium]
MMNGIIGALLDCHSNWTAAYTLMKERGLEAPPCTVTAEFSVKLKRPAPMTGLVTLRAKSVAVNGDQSRSMRRSKPVERSRRRATGYLSRFAKGTPRIIVGDNARLRLT